MKWFDPLDHDLKTIPNVGGVYLLYNSDNLIPPDEKINRSKPVITGFPTYVGQSRDLKERFRDRQRAPMLGPYEDRWFGRPLVEHGVYIEINDPNLRLAVESLLISTLRPLTNVKGVGKKKEE